MSLKVQKWVGNILIVLSLLGLNFIYYPYLKELLFPPQITQEVKLKTNFSVEIPSQKVFSKIIENVDPYNQKEYIEKLKLGVAHAKGTSLPGEKGTIYLFAHSSDVPWRITRYNTAFFKLGNTNIDDEIIVRRNVE